MFWLACDYRRMVTGGLLPTRYRLHFHSLKAPLMNNYPLSALAPLYRVDKSHVFFDMLPTKTMPFNHGDGEVVAEFPARSAEGYTCVVAETRMPASFWTAVVSAPGQVTRKFTTGSGDEVGKLIRRLCEAFQDGQGSLAYEEFEGDDETLCFTATLQEDGRPCEVSAMRDGIFSLYLDDCSGFMGTKRGHTFWVRDRDLAIDLAKSFGEGMLDIEHVR